MKTLQWTPDELLRLSGNYWQSFTLHAAVVLDVFTQIGNDRLTNDNIAQRLNGDTRGVTMLLNALTAMKLLGKADGRYFNTPEGKQFLSKDSPGYIGYIIMHHHHLADSWNRLDQAVKTGAPVRKRASDGNEKARESFLMGMFNIAMTMAPRLVAAVDLSDRRHLLDLGGGPGTYAIHFCLHNPGLKAVVYDLPATRPFALKTIETFGLSDRIEFRAGDYLKKNIQGRYDVAWLSQILHAEGPSDCRRIIEKVVSVLEPGGLIVIHEFLLNDTMDEPLFPALFSLNMLLGTAGGQAYSQTQVTDMLVDAGVREIRRVSFNSPNHSGIMMGTV
jgi:predicted O-methyltransferase YrrM